MIRLIASDMDGTLLDDQGALNEEFFKIHEKLEERNIKFVVASGRQYHQLYHCFEPISDKIAYISENGALIMYKGKEIFSNIMEWNYLNELIKDALKFKDDVFMVLCGKESAYLNTTNELFLEEAVKYYFNYKIVDCFNEVEDDIFKISIYDLKGLDDNFKSALQMKWGEKLEIVASTPYWLDIYNKGVNKGKAVNLLQSKFNIKKMETMIFGDYYNDLEMLQEGYHSYAMKNAPQEIKEAANFIAKSNSENGVLEIIKEKVLK